MLFIIWEHILFIVNLGVLHSYMNISIFLTHSLAAASIYLSICMSLQGSGYGDHHVNWGYYATQPADLGKGHAVHH